MIIKQDFMINVFVVYEILFIVFGLILNSYYLYYSKIRYCRK